MPFNNLNDAKFAAGIINDGMQRLGYGNDSLIDVGDEATTATIEQGMKRIGALPADIVNPLLNQIDIILIYRNYATMFTSSKNPTRVFWRDAINYGGGEEDIYQEILSPIEGVLGIWAQDYANGDANGDLALANAKYHFGYHAGKTVKKFHTKKAHFDIAISLSEHEISKIFTPEGFAGYVSVRLANIQYSAEIALMNAVIDNIKKMVSDGAVKFRENFNINTMNGITELVEDIKSTTEGMKQPTALFNKAEILTMSDTEDLFLVTTPEYYSRMMTRGAENAYNLEQYMFKNRVLYLPAGTDFGTSENGQSVYAVLIDRRAIVMALRYWSMRPFIPSGNDWQNYFMKVEYLHGYNEFFNGVAFAGEGFDDFFNETPESFVTYAVNLIAPGDQPEIITDGVIYDVTGEESALLVDVKMIKSATYIDLKAPSGTSIVQEINISVDGGEFVKVSTDGIVGSQVLHIPVVAPHSYTIKVG